MGKNPIVKGRLRLFEEYKRFRESGCEGRHFGQFASVEVKGSGDCQNDVLVLERSVGELEMPRIDQMGEIRRRRIDGRDFGIGILRSPR